MNQAGSLCTYPLSPEVSLCPSFLTDLVDVPYILQFKKPLSAVDSFQKYPLHCFSQSHGSMLLAFWQRQYKNYVLEENRKIDTAQLR